MLPSYLIRKSDWPWMNLHEESESRHRSRIELLGRGDCGAAPSLVCIKIVYASPRCSELLVAAFDRADQMAEALVLRMGKNARPDTRQIRLMIEQLRKSTIDGPKRKRRVVH